MDVALLRVGVRSVRDVVCADEDFVVASAGVGAEEYTALRKPVVLAAAALPVRGDVWLAQSRAVDAAYTTGNAVVDDMLGGGVRTCEVTELAGAPGTGKTALALSMVLRACAYDVAATAVVLDASNNVDASRLLTILDAEGIPKDQWQATLERVTVVPVADAHTALGWLDHHAGAWMAEATAPRILVVDSVATLFSPVLSANGSFRGHALLATFGRRLRTLALDFRIAVLVTNHYSARQTRVDWNDDWIGGPALGRAWTFTPSASIVLVRHSGTSVVAQLQRSTWSVRVHPCLWHVRAS